MNVRLSTPPSSISASGVRRRGRVLIVDDEALVARCLRRALAVHDTVLANSGQAALELLEREDFDVVLCDLMMPDMTGMELSAQLAVSRPELLHRVVFMTGGAYTPEARAMLERSTNPCLEKPFDVHELRGVVDRAMARRAA